MKKIVFLSMVVALGLSLVTAVPVSAGPIKNSAITPADCTAGTTTDYSITFTVKDGEATSVVIDFSAFGIIETDMVLSGVSTTIGDYSFTGFPVNPTGVTVNDTTKIITFTGGTTTADTEHTILNEVAGAGLVITNDQNAETRQVVLSTTSDLGKFKLTIDPGAIDHYRVSGIDSPQVAGTAFDVTIQAQDEYNNDITTGPDASENITISFGKPDAGATPTSANTANGKATVNMTMTVAQTGQSITFTGDTSGKIGTSNNFDINPGAIDHYTESEDLPSRDTKPPLNSDISVTDITENSVDIHWKTNERSTTQVEYWSSPSRFSPLNEALSYNHLVHLTDLTPGTTYHYKTMSMDSAGNLAVSDERTFATLGEAPAAAFSTSDLSISPSEVNIGETVTISILVANTGNLAGSYEVTLKINDVVEATKEVTVDAGTSEEVTFTTARDLAGSYTVAVNDLSASFMVVAPAAFSVSNLSVKPIEAQPKEAVTITVSVANTGDTEGSYTTVLTINDVKEAQKSVTVAAGSRQDVIFTTSKEEAGGYYVAVDGLSGTFSVVAPINWPSIGGIIAGVIAVGLLIFFLVVKRRA